MEKVLAVTIYICAERDFGSEFEKFTVTEAQAFFLNKKKYLKKIPLQLCQYENNIIFEINRKMSKGSSTLSVCHNRGTWNLAPGFGPSIYLSSL